jgi:hypothetical protein
VLILIGIFALAGSFLLLSLVLLHKLLKGGFGVTEIISFGFDPGPFLRVLADLKFGVGLIGCDDAFG